MFKHCLVISVLVLQMATSTQPALLDFDGFLDEKWDNESGLIPYLTQSILHYIISDRDPNNCERHKTGKRVDSWRSDGLDYQNFPYSVPAYAPDQQDGEWLLHLLSSAKFPATSKRDDCRILDFSEAGYG